MSYMEGLPKEGDTVYLRYRGDYVSGVVTKITTVEADLKRVFDGAEVSITFGGVEHLVYRVPYWQDVDGIHIDNTFFNSENKLLEVALAKELEILLQAVERYESVKRKLENGISSDNA